MGQVASSSAELSGGRANFYRLWSPAVDKDELSEDVVAEDRDYSGDLPDECLALFFQFLGAGDRNRCSLVCKRWLRVDGQSRQRLALDARAEVVHSLPSIFTRFDSVAKLALRCDRRSISLNDDALAMISVRCVNLTRLKLRGCREVTDLGLEVLAQNCKGLRKFSCSSCNFGARGLNAVVDHCLLLEELTVKRLRGIEGAEAIQPGAAASSSLKLICLKELINGQCFEPLISGSKELKTLKIIHCLGDWDKTLELIGKKNSSLSEVHLERLQVSDMGLSSLSKCPKIESLHLLKTPECSNVGLLCVAENCKLLRKLHIDGWRTNRMGDDGLVGVAKHCPNLQELVLIGVNATDASLAAIASNCLKLERLALCGSGTIGDAEMACIASKCQALKKLCIKGCPVSDIGIEALAAGCPNLVKLKVKKCRVVNSEVGERLRQRRSSLIVAMDGGEIESEVAEISGSDGGGPQETAAVHGVAAEASSTGASRLTMLRTKLGSFASRNIVACRFRRWSNGDEGSN